MNKDDTTSSSRIFVKITMEDVTESMGLPTLKERFSDPEIKGLCTGMFLLDNTKDARFSMNFFTSVRLGALTREMRKSQGEPDIQRFVHYRADALFPRTRPASS